MRNAIMNFRRLPGAPSAGRTVYRLCRQLDNPPRTRLSCPRQQREANVSNLTSKLLARVTSLTNSRLAAQTVMHHIESIELRPNDLASPRMPRRTDDFPPNLERNRPRRRATSLQIYLRKKS